MTFKQLLRRLFADLWFRCAKLAEHKIEVCGYTSGEHAAWWEAFILRCEKRALHHGEFVPGKEPSSPEPQKDSR